jgi:hypothetical protein
MFIVDKTPYKFIRTTLAAGDTYSVPAKDLFNKHEGGCTQIQVVVGGDADANVNYRIDPDLTKNALDGIPLFQYGSIELKNFDAIRNLRLYCVVAATVYITLMR